MDSTLIAKSIFKALVLLALTVLALYFIYELRVLIGYVLLAAVIALMGRPVVIFLRRRLGFPNVLAVSIFLLLFLAVVIGIIAMALPVLRDHGENILFLKADSIQSEINTVYQQISEALGTSPEKVEEVVDQTKINEQVVEGLDMATLLKSMVSVLASISVGLFSVLFISFFFLKDSKIIQRLILQAVPKNQETGTLNSLARIKTLLPRYFIGLIGQLTILFCIYSITLLLADVDNSLIIAFYCALFNIIPYLGPIIGGIIMMLMTVMDYLEPGHGEELLPILGLVCLGILIGQLIDNFFSQPYIFSSSVKSHPLEIFLVIIMAGLLFGVIGMIAAVPGYTVLKVILKEFFSQHRLVRYITKKI